jgi:hypothetical protein
LKLSIPASRTENSFFSILSRYFSLMCSFSSSPG